MTLRVIGYDGAEYFSQIRKNGNYLNRSKDEIKHVDEVSKFLHVMTTKQISDTIMDIYALVSDNAVGKDIFIVITRTKIEVMVGDDEKSNAARCQYTESDTGSGKQIFYVSN